MMVGLFYVLYEKTKKWEKLCGKRKMWDVANNDKKKIIKWHNFRSKKLLLKFISTYGMVSMFCASVSDTKRSGIFNNMKKGRN